MKVQMVNILAVSISGQELQSSGHRVSGNIKEYLHNLPAKQAIICSEGALRNEGVTRT
jgi:hypothetical protein